MWFYYYENKKGNILHIFADIQPIAEVVGGDPSVSLPVAPAVSMEETLSNLENNEESFRIDYLLTMEDPKHVSRVQLRGCQRPSWHPGFHFIIIFLQYYFYSLLIVFSFFFNSISILFQWLFSNIIYTIIFLVFVKLQLHFHMYINWKKGQAFYVSSKL